MKKIKRLLAILAVHVITLASFACAGTETVTEYTIAVTEAAETQEAVNVPGEKPEGGPSHWVVELRTHRHSFCERGRAVIVPFPLVSY